MNKNANSIGYHLSERPATSLNLQMKYANNRSSGKPTNTDNYYIDIDRLWHNVYFEWR